MDLFRVYLDVCFFFSISNFCLGATEVNYWRLRKLWDRSFEFSGYLGASVKGYRVSLRRNGQKHSRSSQIWILVWIIRARGLTLSLKQLYWNSPTLYSKGYTWGAPLCSIILYWKYAILDFRESSGFQVTGMIEEYLGVWNFRFWDFLWHRKILASTFLGSLIKYGFFWLFHSHVSFCVVAYDTLWRFWNPRDFWGGVDFWPHSIILVIWNPGYPPPHPLGSTFFLLIIAVVTLLSVKITILVSAPKVFTHSWNFWHVNSRRQDSKGGSSR